MISNAISRHAETLDCEFWSRQRRVGTGRGASLGRSRFASTALRYSVLRPVAQLAAFTTLRQGATRMIRTRFALAASPAFLGAPEARRATKSEHSRLRARFRIATASHGVQE